MQQLRLYTECAGFSFIFPLRLWQAGESLQYVSTQPYSATFKRHYKIIMQASVCHVGNAIFGIC